MTIERCILQDLPDNTASLHPEILRTPLCPAVTLNNDHTHEEKAMHVESLSTHLISNDAAVKVWIYLSFVSAISGQAFKNNNDRRYYPAVPSAAFGGLRRCLRLRELSTWQDRRDAIGQGNLGKTWLIMQLHVIIVHEATR